MRPFPKDRGKTDKTNGVWKPYKWPQWLGQICNFQHHFDLYVLLYDQFHTYTHTQPLKLYQFMFFVMEPCDGNIFIVHYMQKCFKNWIIAATKEGEEGEEENTILFKINNFSHRLCTLSFSCVCLCVCARECVGHCKILCTKF